MLPLYKIHVSLNTLLYGGNLLLSFLFNPCATSNDILSSGNQALRVNTLISVIEAVESHLRRKLR